MSKPKKRKVLANGRNVCERFIALPHYMIRSPAWLTMSAAAKALLIQVWSRHNGMNNGEIAYSVREAAAIGLAKSVTARAFAELVERGFLSVGRASTFNLKTKEARTWRLTAEPTATQAATKDFMRWQASIERSENKSRSPQRDTQSLQRDRDQIDATILPSSVPPAGPLAPVDTLSQSLQRDTSILPCGGGEAALSQDTVDGAAIKLERERRKLSLRTLASMAGTSHNAVALVEKGKLNGAAFHKIAAALDMGVGAMP